MKAMKFIFAAIVFLFIQCCAECQIIGKHTCVGTKIMTCNENHRYSEVVDCLDAESLENSGEYLICLEEDEGPVCGVAK